ncbi:hypothetical protein CDD83_10106 [Cordyceps sp. RAO-2017]|nr:hypothetical protein CDD83_10106 [Cordyceps sp. RAO-2017]
MTELILRRVACVPGPVLKVQLLVRGHQVAHPAFLRVFRDADLFNGKQRKISSIKAVSCREAQQDVELQHQGVPSRPV